MIPIVALAYCYLIYNSSPPGYRQEPDLAVAYTIAKTRQLWKT